MAIQIVYGNVQIVQVVKVKREHVALAFIGRWYIFNGSRKKNVLISQLFLIFSNEHLVWSPSGQAELCQGTSASKNPPESCNSCLGCSNANTCSTTKCSSSDTGTCCYKRSDPNSKPDTFVWYCMGCANCPSGYTSTAYEMTQASCRACKSGESSSSGNCV